MIKYIVTWLVINSYSVPCPVQPPIEDEYGRVTQPSMQLAIVCYKSDTTFKTKEFVSRKEAIEFIKKGEPDSVYRLYGSMWPLINNAVLAGFKLDSIITKK